MELGGGRPKSETVKNNQLQHGRREVAEAMPGFLFKPSLQRVLGYTFPCEILSEG